MLVIFNNQTHFSSPRRFQIALFVLVLAFILPHSLKAQELEAVQVYSQDELIRLINLNQHLARIKEDRCQIVEDIEARAEIMHIPSFQFLWGDMLAWGVCVDANSEKGIHYIRQAAAQGLPAALEQLGRYYSKGKLVQQDTQRAVIYLREAAALGNLSAQLQLAQLFEEGNGSPYDYADIYHWLYNAVTDNPQQHKKIGNHLRQLEKLMHPKAVREARRSLVE